MSIYVGQDQPNDNINKTLAICASTAHLVLRQENVFNTNMDTKHRQSINQTLMHDHKTPRQSINQTIVYHKEHLLLTEVN